jgi:hypothetical protein
MNFTVMRANIMALAAERNQCMDEAQHQGVATFTVTGIIRDNDKLIVDVIVNGDPQTLYFEIKYHQDVGQMIGDHDNPTSRIMFEHAYATRRCSGVLYDYLNGRPQPLPIEFRDEPALGNPAPNRTQ